MTKKTNMTGAFAEVKVSKTAESRIPADPTDFSWRYIRLTYPNGVTITLPSSIEPDRLASFIYLK